MFWGIHALQGYQAQIVEACMEYADDKWLCYDRRFCQNAAASPGEKWAQIDPTLWSKAFTSKAWVERCKHCFSLTHTDDECDWAPSKPNSNKEPQQVKQPMPPQRMRHLPAQICKSWNYSHDAICVFPNCTYQHICLYCAQDPNVPKEHKIIHCLKFMLYKYGS